MGTTEERDELVEELRRQVNERERDELAKEIRQQMYEVLGTMSGLSTFTRQERTERWMVYAQLANALAHLLVRQ